MVEFIKNWPINADSCISLLKIVHALPKKGAVSNLLVDICTRTS